jgi:hypothetical protein
LLTAIHQGLEKPLSVGRPDDRIEDFTLEQVARNRERETLPFQKGLPQVAMSELKKFGRVAKITRAAAAASGIAARAQRAV